MTGKTKVCSEKIILMMAKILAFLIPTRTGKVRMPCLKSPGSSSMSLMSSLVNIKKKANRIKGAIRTAPLGWFIILRIRGVVHKKATVIFFTRGTF